MKSFIKKLQFIPVILGMAALYIGCNKGPDISEYNYPEPLPTGTTPDSGYTGTNIIITGSSFGAYKNVVKVYFNGIAADSILSCEDGKIIARVPKNAISGKISLQVWTHTVDSVGSYRVIATPTADSISRVAGLPGDTVIIMGSGFGNDPAKVKVSFNGPLGTLTAITDSTITAIVPSGFSAGNLVVYVNDFPVQGPKFGALATVTNPVYWLAFEGNLNDKMGGTASTYTYNTTYAKPIGYDNGVSGQAVKLAGASNVATTNCQVLALPPQTTKYKELTVACWVNWFSDSGWVQEPVFDAGQARGDRLCLMTKMNSGFGTGYQNLIGRLAFENIGTYGTPPTYYNAIANQALPTKSWHHVALVISYANGSEKVYLDGILVGSVTLPATADPTLFSHNKVYIGAPTNGVKNEPAFGGLIDEFKVFNYALTPEQVFTEYYHK